MSDAESQVARDLEAHEDAPGIRAAEAMRQRTRQFALRVLHVSEALPRKRTADVMGRQLLRAGTGVGANYRAACRAKSRADFVAKMGIVEEEADETAYWMELIAEAKLLPPKRLEPLITEANEIVAIIVASINTARGGKRRPRQSIRNPQSAIRNKHG
ncbi:MAG: four helix bundle protein [Planctomycetota bacterium]